MMGVFNCPIVNARMTSKFGWRNIGSGREWHQGVDLCDQVIGKKVPVYASAEGEVIRTGELSSYGNVVMIRHIVNNKIMETNYAHLSKISVKVGQKVKQGQQIGISGSTGRSTGIHLHFEVHQGKYAPSQPNAIDPMKWIELTTCVPYKDSYQRPEYANKIGYNVPKNSKAFRIHTGAFKSKSEADKAQVSFVKKGYLKYAEVFGDNKNGYRLQSGKYTSQKDAENTSKKMLDAELISFASIIGNKE